MRITRLRNGRRRVQPLVSQTDWAAVMQDREVITTITTPRLELMPATVSLVQAELRGPEELGSGRVRPPVK